MGKAYNSYRAGYCDVWLELRGSKLDKRAHHEIRCMGAFDYPNEDNPDEWDRTEYRRGKVDAMEIALIELAKNNLQK